MWKLASLHDIKLVTNCVNRHKNHETHTLNWDPRPMEITHKTFLIFLIIALNRKGHGRATIGNQPPRRWTWWLAISCWTTATISATRQLFLVDFFIKQLWSTLIKYNFDEFRPWKSNDRALSARYSPSRKLSAQHKSFLSYQNGFKCVHMRFSEWIENKFSISIIKLEKCFTLSKLSIMTQ